MSRLQRTLSFSSVLAIVVGGVIGSGIFMKPATMLSQLGSPLLLLMVWLVAGVVVLFGALTNAEAAALFPETGGQYVFFEQMYGRGFAFLYGWSAFAVFNTAGNASIAYVCSTYADYFLHLPRLAPAVEQGVRIPLPGIGAFYPLQHLGLKLLTALLIVGFTWVNARSVRLGAGLQRLLTALKLVAILLLVAGIFSSGRLQPAFLFNEAMPVPAGWSLFTAFMAATAGAFWAYDGWNNVTFLAGEIRQPHRTIPRSLLAGLLICIAVYILLNSAFVLVLSPGSLAGSAFVAADAAAAVWGATGAALIVVLVVASTLGTTNSNVLATARVTFAMGTASRWFRPAAAVHPRWKTPAVALRYNAVWTVLLIFTGSFDALTDMLIFVSWFFYGMSALGVMVLRVRMKEAVRPYRVWGYPVVPVVFVLFTGFFLAGTLYHDIQQYRQGVIPFVYSLLGVLIAAMGIPVYLLSGKRYADAPGN